MNTDPAVRSRNRRANHASGATGCSPGESRIHRWICRAASALLVVGGCALHTAHAATLKVDASGQTPGAYTTLSQAAIAVRAGDTIVLVPGSGPYREMLDVRVRGTLAAPIVIEGNGETVTGAEPFEFRFNGATGLWEYTLPDPVSNQAGGAANRFRHLVTYRGQRLLLERVGGRLTSDLATLSDDGLTLVLGNASASSGWEIGVRPIAVRVSSADTEPVAWHHVYRNLRATGARNDGFNLHGTGTDLRFENIEGFNNFDEGFSAHDSIHCSIDGGVFWGNDNGLYNESSQAIAMEANNVRTYANLGSGISMRQGVGSLTNSQAWDNGISNVALGGTLTVHSVTTFQNRWPQPPFVSFQETQGQPLGLYYPYTYEAFWKGKPADALHQAYDMTGEEPDVRGVARLPAFALAYVDWRYLYFSPDQITDPATSGPDADPDGDGRPNQQEYLAGSRPLTADSPAVVVSVMVPDNVARTTPADDGLIVIRRSGPTDQPLTIYYSMGGSANPGSDYATLDSPMQIPAGSESVELFVAPVDDGMPDVPKLVVLTLIDDPSYLVGAATGTVNLDTVDLPILTLSVPDASASETAGEDGLFRLRRSGSASEPLRVDFIVSGSATPGDDYPGFGSAIEFPAGASTLDLVVDAVDDGEEESTESVILSLSNAPGYRLANAIGVITIEGLPLSTVTLDVTDASASEAAGNPGLFTVTRSSGADALTIFFTVSGTATPGEDYGAIGNSVTIPAGEMSASVTVLPIDDGVAESSESVVLNLANQTTYVIGSPRSGTVTIANYTPPTVSVTTIDPSASEVGDNVGVFSVMRSGAKTEALLVRYSMSGSATSGSDYVATSAMLEIPAGSSSATVTITPLPDNLVEGTETAVLTVIADAAYVPAANATGSVNITDAVLPAVSVTTNDSAASESGGNTGLFTISRTGPKTSALTVWFAMGGSATTGADYTDPGVSVVIAAGSSQATILIDPVADTLAEGPETAVLTLIEQSTYALGASITGTVKIADAGSNLTVTLDVTDASASEAAGNPGLFTVTRSSGADALTIFFTVSGTATPGEDYGAIGNSVTIPAGEMSASVTVLPIDDGVAESSESVVLNLANQTTYVIGSPRSGTVTIANYTPPTVSVTTIDPSASEVGDNVGVFSVMRSGAKTEALLVRYSMSGSATSGSDYVATSAMLEIPAGSSSATVTITPLPDNLVEGTETAVLTVIADAAYVPAANATGSVNITDAVLPAVSVTTNDSAASESGGNTGLFTISRTGPKTSALTVWFAMGGSATTGADYTDPGVSVVIAAGSSQATILIDPVADTLAEGPETAVLTLIEQSTYALGASITGTVKIADATLLKVSLAANDSIASEIDGQSGALGIRRSGISDGAPSVPVTIGETDPQVLVGPVAVLAGTSASVVPVVPGVDELSESPVIISAS
jgi:hypothetical protein